MKPYKHKSSDLVFAEIAGPSRIDFSRVRRSRASVLNFFADQFLQENDAKSMRSYAMRINA